MTAEIPLQQDIFTGELTDTRLTKLALSPEDHRTPDEIEREEALSVTSLSREDLLYSRPDLVQTIDNLTPSQLRRIAEKLGDVLQDSYWMALGIILMEQFGLAADEYDIVEGEVDDTTDKKSATNPLIY